MCFIRTNLAVGCCMLPEIESQIELSDEQYDMIHKLVMNPPKPSDRLKKALSRIKDCK
jgi:uncharacterized protein (DUF1778 family)